MSDETMSVLETVARATDPDAWLEYMPIPTRTDTVRFHLARQESAQRARAALRALGMTEAMMQQPAGSVVVVPVEATTEMLQAACEEAVEYPEADDQIAVYRAMIAARPGAGDSA